MIVRMTKAQYENLQKRGGPIKRTAHRLTGRRWEIAFADQLDAEGIPYLCEYRFAEGRKFRFDFAFPAKKIAVEIDGMVHRIRVRFLADREKGNLAILYGWRVLHVGSDAVRDGRALAILKQLL